MSFFKQLLTPTQLVEELTQLVEELTQSPQQLISQEEQSPQQLISQEEQSPQQLINGIMLLVEEEEKLMNKLICMIEDDQQKILMLEEEKFLNNNDNNNAFQDINDKNEMFEKINSLEINLNKKINNFNLLKNDDDKHINKKLKIDKGVDYVKSLKEEQLIVYENVDYVKSLKEEELIFDEGVDYIKLLKEEEEKLILKNINNLYLKQVSSEERVEENELNFLYENIKFQEFNKITPLQSFQYVEVFFIYLYLAGKKKIKSNLSSLSTSLPLTCILKITEYLFFKVLVTFSIQMRSLSNVHFSNVYNHFQFHNKTLDHLYAINLLKEDIDLSIALNQAIIYNNDTVNYLFINYSDYLTLSQFEEILNLKAIQYNSHLIIENPVIEKPYLLYYTFIKKK